MGNTTTTKKAAAPAAAPAPEKAKRTVLTTEQKIAKLEAEAKALREKAQTDAKAKITKVEDDLAKAKDRAKAANTKVEDIERELTGLRQVAGVASSEGDKA